MVGEDVLANYGLWAIIITIGVIIVAGIIKALSSKAGYERRPRGTRQRRKRLPSGKNRKTRKRP